MEKDKITVNKFNRYANHLTSRKESHTNKCLQHNINIDKYCNDFENFYAMNPDFFVEDCNMIMKSLNDDYNKYMKWIVDD